MGDQYVIQIMWHLNNECNISCKHCYNRKQGRRPVDRWEFQKLMIYRIVELARVYRIIRVGLLGGEPLLDPSLLKAIAHLRKEGIERIDISTNGLLADCACADGLKVAGVKMVQVSLEGPNAATNDPIRGQGSFDKALAGLKNLRASGLDTGIMMTVSRSNLGAMGPMVDLARNEGVKIVSFNRLLPIGHGSSGELTPLDPDETRRMIETVHNLDHRHTDIDVSSDDPLLFIPTPVSSRPAAAAGGCGAGIGNLAICHDGTVFPCRRLPIPVGNAKDSSLVDILNSAALDCFYDRRGFLKGACGSCSHRETCGGCRAAAYAVTGDHLSQDPQCWIPLERR